MLPMVNHLLNAQMLMSCTIFVIVKSFPKTCTIPRDMHMYSPCFSYICA